MYEETFCTDCKKFTQVICDQAAGDMICTECGLVLESHCIDETSEWRTFSDSVDKDDPVRVGCPTNPLLADFALTTVISKAPKAKATTETKTGDTNNNRFTLGRCNSRGSLNNEPDRALVSGFQKIDLMADKLGLVHTITTRAKEICKKLEDQKCTRGRNQNAILAACLLIACRQEEKERTLKEIFSIANGATMKQIGQAQKFIVKQLDLGEVGTINTGGCMNRFCSLLGMSHRTSKAAQEAVMKCEEVDIRRSPTTLAAVIIYVLNQLSDDKKSLKSIAMVTGVAETTIRSSYKDLYPHVSKIIPGWYAKEADLRKLCCP